MPDLTRDRQVQSWKQGQPKSYMWVEGIQLLEPWLLPLRICTGRKLKPEPGIKARHCHKEHGCLTARLNAYSWPTSDTGKCTLFPRN